LIVHYDISGLIAPGLTVSTRSGYTGLVFAFNTG